MSGCRGQRRREICMQGCERGLCIAGCGRVWQVCSALVLNRCQNVIRPLVGAGLAACEWSSSGGGCRLLLADSLWACVNGDDADVMRQDAACILRSSGAAMATALPPCLLKGTMMRKNLPDSARWSATRPAMTKHWEAELDALKGNNAKLTAALLESTANVKQWKQQLAAYQEEAERLHKRVTELECQSSQSPAIKSQKTELNQTIEELENTLRDKEEEMEKLKEELENMNDLMEQKDTLTQKLEETDLRSRVLEEQLAGAEQRLEENQEEQENFRKSLRTLLEMLDGKIFELTELRDTLARLIEEAS
ncbi:homer protein homolog 1b isoform X3 [Platichthys flesus]|uniref:homer protein homolog 1b isoform X3 n=1 Tax=Platichthys flesus TaxID=8260 RepID=UPI002DBCAC7C|nr:homer protein homolog 1b isoform X3 [Platichthys flesus]